MISSEDPARPWTEGPANFAEKASLAVAAAPPPRLVLHMDEASSNVRRIPADESCTHHAPGPGIVLQGRASPVQGEDPLADQCCSGAKNGCCFGVTLSVHRADPQVVANLLSHAAPSISRCNIPRDPNHWRRLPRRPREPQLAGPHMGDAAHGGSLPARADPLVKSRTHNPV